MSMIPEAKRELSNTIRSLRTRLLDDMHDATESAYRLSVHEREAGLSEAARARRARLDAWIKEQERAEAGHGRTKRTKEDIRRDAEKQAAYTLLNRIIFLRLLEAVGIRKPAVVTGGWESGGYKDFRSLAPALVRGDESEGYTFLLRLVFEDLATELPGLYGHAGVAELVPIPASTLRHVVEELDDPRLRSCWTDDMTLGWVYQYWNDPEREALDAKLNSGGKLAPHEIASKTQMFTERYMVEWLLQNSLGPMWLAMCEKHGWTAEVEADGTLTQLEERRAEWRAKREAGEVSLTELMPLHTDTERRWAYYLAQPIPDDAVEHALESIRDLKALDPAVGSGHFLVVLFDLLLALYREEAKHRGEEGQERWSTRAIVESILENNLHGIDLDARAVQIAAAALWLKAKQACPEATPTRLNLVASNLRLASLPDDDPALVELRREVERETGIPAQLTDTIVHSLQGADHLGSLLKIDVAVDEAIRKHEEAFGRVNEPVQGRLFGHTPPSQPRLTLDRDAAKASVLERLEVFLGLHTAGDDLGLRLRGEQLALGVRFVRMLKEGAFDLVVGNPPYQGTSKMQDATYISRNYPRGRADLYAAFLERGLQIARVGGTTALLTMRNWMFIKQYAELWSNLLRTQDLRAIGDFAIGAFDDVPNDVLSVCVSVFRRTHTSQERSVAQQPTSPEDRSYDRDRTRRKRAATLSHRGILGFHTQSLEGIGEMPLVYWWGDDLLERYSSAPKVFDTCKVRAGLTTGDNPRFCRAIWEPCPRSIFLSRHPSIPPSIPNLNYSWVQYIKGGAGDEWFDSCDTVLRWDRGAIEKLVVHEERGNKGGGNGTPSRELYFREGLAVSPIGHIFSVRAHRFACVFSNMGTSLFPSDLARTLCSLNRSEARRIVQSLNPRMHFEAGDINRLPLIEVTSSHEILDRLSKAFGEHESHRETSVEYRGPGPSPWQNVQAWAQAAVDRPDGTPLPPYEPECEQEPATDHLSFAFGLALGRFGPNGEGILDPANGDLPNALPSGILFLDGTLDASDLRDGLGSDAARPNTVQW